jgi:hypothetical protein
MLLLQLYYAFYGKSLIFYRPFPSIQRLIRHCKEVHVTKQTLKSVAPENRSK